MKKIKVLVVPSDRTGVGYYRSINPHLHLEKMYPDEFHVDIDFEPQIYNNEWLKQYDIIHYHKLLGPFDKMEELNNTFKSLGIVSIMDLDDYWAPGQHHPLFITVKYNEFDKKIANNLRLAQYVTTTTNLFADEIKKINKNVTVIPNGIDLTEPQFKINPTTNSSGRIRIGWLGGSSHLKDLEMLEGVVSKLKGEGLLDKIQFVLCGFDINGVNTVFDPKTKKVIGSNKIKPEESVWVAYEKIFTSNYTTISSEYKNHLDKFSKEEYPNVDNEPYRRVWTKDINSYASNYNLFDISLAPLENNIFNKCKSQLKVIEAGVFRKPIIASNFGPYTIDLVNAFEKGGVINDNANSFIVDLNGKNKDWVRFIKKLVETPELVSKLGNNLYETVVPKYSLNKISEIRRDFYKKLINIR